MEEQMMSAMQQAQGLGSVEEMQQQQAQKAAYEEQRGAMIEQIFLPEAMDRLKRMAMVKPEKARVVEDSFLKAAQSGQLRQKVSEAALIEWLNQNDAAVSGKSGKSGITIQRRKTTLDDDSDNDDDFS